MVRARFAFPVLPCFLAVIIVALHDAVTASAMRTALSAGDGSTAPRKSRSARNRKAKASKAANKGSATATLIATPKGTAHDFARVLATRLQQEGTAQISAVGPAASYMSLKALVMANKKMAKELRGKVLAVSPSKHNVSLKSGQETTGHLLEVLVVPKVDVAKKPDSLSAGESDSRRLAGFMSRRLKRQDGVTLGGIGSKAIYRILKAAVSAQDSLAKSQGAGNSKLALVPGLTSIKMDGKKMIRMQLACVRADAGVGRSSAGGANEPLLASSRGNTRSTARALSERLKREGTAQLNAVGASASYMAFKAIMVASTMLAKELRGNVLAVTVSKQDVPLKKVQEAVAYSLEVSAVPAIKAAKNADAMSTNTTKSRRLAGVISRRFKKHDMITIGAMGRQAVYRALQAILDAQDTLAKEPGAGKSKLALVPSVVEFKNAGETMQRVHLACFHAPANFGRLTALGASPPLVAAAKGIPRVFAGALAARVKEEGTAQISAIGPAATYMAVKALMLTNKNMAKDFPGKVLAVTPSKQEAIPTKAGQKAVVYLLEVRAVSKMKAAKEADMTSTNRTNSRRLAGAMSRRLKKQNVVTVGAMGAKAAYRVLKATAAAQERLAKEQGAGNSTLALVPTLVEFDKDGEKLSRMQLACVRVPVARKAARAGKASAARKGAASGNAVAGGKVETAGSGGKGVAGGKAATGGKAAAGGNGGNTATGGKAAAAGNGGKAAAGGKNAAGGNAAAGGKAAAGGNAAAGGKIAPSGPNAPLKATSMSNPGVFAGAVVGRLKEGRTAQIDVVGPRATYAVLKAMIMGNGYMADALRGKLLAVTASKEGILMRGQSRVGYSLEVRAVPGITAATEPDLVSTNATDTRMVAGLLFRELNKKSTVTIGAVGATAAYRTLKAAVRVQDALAKDLAKKKRKSKLALVPRFAEVEKGGLKLKQMLLTCMRV